MNIIAGLAVAGALAFGEALTGVVIVLPAETVQTGGRLIVKSG